MEFIDLSSDDESGDVGPRAIKLESDFVEGAKQINDTNKGQLKHQKSHNHSGKQDSEENRSSNGPTPSTVHSSSSVLEQGLSPVDDRGLSFTSPIGPAPLCKQFWKAGNYDDGLGSKITVQSNLINSTICKSVYFNY